MMRQNIFLCLRRLSAANFDAAIDLARIGVDEFTVDFFLLGERIIAFSRSSGTDDGNKGGLTQIRPNFLSSSWRLKTRVVGRP